MTKVELDVAGQTDAEAFYTQLSKALGGPDFPNLNFNVFEDAL